MTPSHRRRAFLWLMLIIVGWLAFLAFVPHQLHWRDFVFFRDQPQIEGN